MTFDPTLRRLITGARNGSVKIWNFNNGACLRELLVIERSEITGIVCPRNRIITGGWNRSLTVYLDTKDEDDESTQIRWRGRHKEDITDLAFNPPSTIASCAYDGDIFIWSLETGYITIVFNAHKSTGPIAGLSCVSNAMRSTRGMPVEEAEEELEFGQEQWPQSSAANNKKRIGPVYDDFFLAPLAPTPHRGRSPSLTPTSTQTRQRRRSSIASAGLPFGQQRIFHKAPPDEPRRCTRLVQPSFGPGVTTGDRSVDRIRFLPTRRPTRTTANLVSAEGGGWIRFWSADHQGGLLGQWNAAHHKEDSIVAMTTDADDEFLITGDSSGYIKVWDIKHYCSRGPGSSRWKEFSMKYLERRRMFTMTKIDPELRFRAADQSKHEPPPSTTNPSKTWKVPPILTSFRGHLSAITGLSYVDDRKLIVTSSSDCSVRVWTLNGYYMGMLGQPDTWRDVSSIQESDVLEKFISFSPRNCRVPRDVRRVASATTLKTFYGGTGPLRRLARSVLMVWLPMLKFRKKQEELPALSRAPSNTVSIDPVRDVGAPSADSAASGDASLSNLLGKNYQRQRKHQVLPKLPDPRLFKNQCAVYSCLPYFTMEEVDNKPKPPQTILDIQDRQQVVGRRYERRSDTNTRPRQGNTRPRQAVVRNSVVSVATGDKEKLLPRIINDQVQNS